MNEVQVILGRRYATAFFAINSNALHRADASSCEHAVALLHAHGTWLSFFDTPHIQQAQQEAMIDLLLKRLELAPIMRPIFVLLCAHNRMILVPDVLHALSVQIYAHEQVLPFVIKSFPALQKTELDVLCSFLHYQTGKEIIPQCVIDRGLIAGVRAESAGLLWEYSIAKRLRDAQHACVSGDDQ